jgi:phytoene dehydrogenase-like protein
VIVGAGPNGLVAANVLASAGWQVVVLEEQSEPGGGVRSAAGPVDGFSVDVCSAFYPLAAASPVLQSLELHRYGLRWLHAPHVLAHPLSDGRAAVLSRDLETTAESMESLGVGDGAAWRRLHGLWQDIGEDLVGSLFTPFPPVRAGLGIAARLRPAGLLRFARTALLPVRRVIEEEFHGQGSMILAGSAMHADLSPESAGSFVFGWLLSMLGQTQGFPVVAGGAGELTAALVRRLEDHGGRVICDAPVREVVVRRGRAEAVRLGDGTELSARRAVLADVVAPRLYGDLVSWEHLPARLRDDMRRFQWDWSTFKVDWAMRAPVPWIAEAARGAGTVHVCRDLDALTMFTAQLAAGRVPSDPFVLMGQMTTSDPSRSPAGTESLWGYTHVPREVRGDAGGSLTGRWDAAEQEAFADRIESQIEPFAPGFRQQILARSIMSPAGLHEHNANLVGGAINGGTASVHQQLIFRPTPGLGRPETPITGLYLASSSAHPGGGVHGACGSNAARAALRGDRLHLQRFSSRTARAAMGRPDISADRGPDSGR